MKNKRVERIRERDRKRIHKGTLNGSHNRRRRGRKNSLKINILLPTVEWNKRERIEKAIDTAHHTRLGVWRKRIRKILFPSLLQPNTISTSSSSRHFTKGVKISVPEDEDERGGLTAIDWERNMFSSYFLRVEKENKRGPPYTHVYKNPSDTCGFNQIF